MQVLLLRAQVGPQPVRTRLKQRKNSEMEGAGRTPNNFLSS